MVNMNLGKKARNTASITNSTCIYGTMSGTGRGIGRNVGTGTWNAIQTRGGKSMPPKYLKCGPETIEYMKKHRMLSVNPVGSGGVGRMYMYF